MGTLILDFVDDNGERRRVGETEIPPDSGMRSVLVGSDEEPSVLLIIVQRMLAGTTEPPKAADGSKTAPLPMRPDLIDPAVNKELPPKRTPINLLSPATIAAVRRAWSQRHTGENLKAGQLAVLMGQLALETGMGKKTWNWNLGNVKAFRPYWKGAYTRLRTREYLTHAEVKDKWGIDLPEWKGERLLYVYSPFRAFSTLEEGAYGWLALLSGRRHGGSIDYVRAGDAEGFGRHIARREDGGTNYTTSPAAKYGPLVAERANWWLKAAGEIV
ncbi:MAG: hypothetical protein ACE5FM_02575 [Methyloligellaceae bacterium]